MRVSMVLIKKMRTNSSALQHGIRSEIAFSARYVMPRFAALLCKTLSVTGSQPNARAHPAEMSSDWEGVSFIRSC